MELTDTNRNNLQSTNQQKLTSNTIFYSIKFYVFCQGLINLSYLVLGAYLKSVITSIEKQFQISSTRSGLIASGFEIGNLLVILPVSYLGSRVHRPRVIAFGAIIMIIGGFLLASPHWLLEFYKPMTYANKAKNLTTHTSLCQATDKNSEHKTKDLTSNPSKLWVLMFLARMLVGIGAAPVQPYGISYMDDHASRADAPLYMGILLSVTMIGPAFGYLLGSGTTKLYVDFDRNGVNLPSSDSGWLGAWWLGFLIASGLTFLAHLPFWFFPISMSSGLTTDDAEYTNFIIENQSAQQPNLSQLDIKQTIESQSRFRLYLLDFLKTTLRLVKNLVFLFIILAYATLMAISAGFAVFLPKYFEVQFDLSASKSNMLIGSVQLPFGIVGVLLGGYMMRKFDLSDKKAITIAVAAGMIGLLVGLPLIVIGCGTRPIVGVTVKAPFPNCYKDCECGNNYHPICAGSTEYLSPCWAGCKSFMHSNNSDSGGIIYYNCSCLENSGLALSGSCPHQCADKLWIGLALSCIILCVICLTLAPIYTVLLRSVSTKDKSFAIGIQFLVMRTLGWLPSPIYFGATIDASCILWESTVGQSHGKGACLVYNNVDLRRRYLGLISGLQGLCVVILVILLATVDTKKSTSKERHARQNSQL